MAHVLAAVDGTIHPRWDKPLLAEQDIESVYPFAALSWAVEDGTYIRLPENAWPDGLKIPYYAVPNDKISLKVLSTTCTQC